MTYKIVDIGDSVSISKDNMSIPRSSNNRHYKMFIEDIALGNDTVEGPDVIEPSYVELRAAAYPSMVDQLDMQYWDGVNGTTTWADAIQAVKDAHPTTVTGGTTVGDVPAWVQEEADAWLAAKQLADYTVAMERLSRYRLADGRAEVRTEVIVDREVVLDDNGDFVLDDEYNQTYRDVTEEVVTLPEIEALPANVTVPSMNEDGNHIETEVANPAIVKDDAERAEAQAVVDATPQAVIDTYNGE
jgi:hypothetical protein